MFQISFKAPLQSRYLSEDSVISHAGSLTHTAGEGAFVEFEILVLTMNPPETAKLFPVAGLSPSIVVDVVVLSLGCK